MYKNNLKNIFEALVAIVLCESAGIIGSFFTISALPAWYETLQKSPLNPPGYIFGPVWSIIYALMGIAAFIIWKQRGSSARNALFIFVIQLLVNAAWSPLFFGLHNPAWALYDIVLLWFTVIVTIFVFFRISKVAGWLLMPYALWISFAFYLNYFIFIHN